MLKRFIHYTHIPQMRQDVSLPEQRPQGRKTPEAYQCLTRLTLGWPRPALAHGYVEDFFEPRTKFGKRRVLARLGKGGYDGAFFSIPFMRDRLVAMAPNLAKMRPWQSVLPPISSPGS